MSYIVAISRAFFRNFSFIKSRAVIILWFVIIMAMILYLYSSIDVRSDISFFLPENTTAIDEAMRYQLKHGEAGKVILIALKRKNNIISSRQLAEINKQLAKKLAQNKDLLLVQNGQLSHAELIIEPFYSYRYLIRKQSNDAQNSIFSQHRLTTSFEHLLQRLEIMISPAEQKIFAEDPQMLWLSMLKQWQSQKLQKQHGVWFDAQGKQTFLFVKTRAEAFDLDQQKRNIDEIKGQIEHQIKNVSQMADTGNIELILTGAPLFALTSKKSISQQTKIISTIASIILMTFLYWFFRSIKIVLLTALPLAIAILSGMTIVMLSDGFIHGITIAFGITIIGIAVDYPVHLYSHVVFLNSSSGSLQSSLQSFLHGSLHGSLLSPEVNEQQNSSQLTAIIRSIWPMMRLGLITTIIGFSAITFSDFSGLRQLGLFALSGLISAAMVTRFLLPLIPVANSSSLQENIAYKQLLSFVKYPIPRFITIISILIVLSAAVYIGFNQSNLWQKDLSALSPIPQWKKQQDFQLRKAMGIAELRYVLIIQEPDFEKLLQQSEQLIPRLEGLKKADIISGYDMAARYLPSIKHQKLQQQNLPGTKILQHRLQQVLEDSEFNISAFSPFLEAVEKSRKMLPLSEQIVLTHNLDHSQSTAQTESQWKNNLIIDKLKALLYQNKTSSIWTAVIPLQGVKNNQLKQSDFKNTQLLDLKAQSETMLSDYRNDALLWFLAGLILIITVLFYSTQKASSLFTLTWPFIGAVVLTIASLLLMGYSLSIFHLVTLLLVVGLGIDYSIFTFFSKHRDGEIRDLKNQPSDVAKVSIIICMTSTLIMFGSLCISDLPVLKAIGITASLGSIYAFILTRLSI